VTAKQATQEGRRIRKVYQQRRHEHQQSKSTKHETVVTSKLLTVSINLIGGYCVPMPTQHATPPWSANTSESWEVNELIIRYTSPLSVLLQLWLVSG